MIGQVFRLATVPVAAAFGLAGELFHVSRSLLTQSPRARRVALAVNVLRGRPTMYRMDIQDGALLVSDGDTMVADCQVIFTPLGIVEVQTSYPARLISM